MLDTRISIGHLPMTLTPVLNEIREYLVDVIAFSHENVDKEIDLLKSIESRINFNN